MQRRSLLRSAAALPLLGVFPGTVLARVMAPFRRVRPQDTFWPSAAEWQALKAQVGGNLLEVQALFAPCAGAPEGDACAEVYKNIRNPFYIGDQAGGTQVSGWLDAWTSGAERLRGAGPSGRRRRRGGELCAPPQPAPGREGRRAQLPWHLERARLAAHLDARMNESTLHDAFVPQGCAGQVAAVRRR